MHLGRLDIFDRDSMSDLYVTIMGEPIIVLFDLKVEEKDTGNFTLFQYLHEVEQVQLAPTTSAHKIMKKSTHTIFINKTVIGHDHTASVVFITTFTSAE